jgi:ABC-type phosphate transport system substrate-binding protein
MQLRFARVARLGVLALVGVLVATAWTTSGFAGPDALRGRITADGSSTVGPFTTAAAEMFQRRNESVQVTVGISGTGGGCARFCNSETDLSENDNVLVRGVAGARGGLGDFGLSYYVENRSQLRLDSVNGGSGCVAPSIGPCRPGGTSRSRDPSSSTPGGCRSSAERFVPSILNNQKAIATRARFVPLTARQAKGQRVRYTQALKTIR